MAQDDVKYSNGHWQGKKKFHMPDRWSPPFLLSDCDVKEGQRHTRASVQGREMSPSGLSHGYWTAPVKRKPLCWPRSDGAHRGWAYCVCIYFSSVSSLTSVIKTK